MPTETELTQLKIYHASTNAIAEAAISGGQVDPNSIIVTDEIDPAVTSIGNAIGDISLGNGLTITNNILSATGIYAHHIYIVGGNQNKTNIYCTLLTGFVTTFDLPSFIAYINNMDSTGTVSATGTVIYNRVGTVEYCRAVAALIPGNPANNTIGIVYHDTGDAGVVKTYTAKQGTGNLDLTSLSDAIVKIM